MSGPGTAHIRAYKTRPKTSSRKCNHGVLQSKQQLYLERDARRVDLGASLLQVRDEMHFLRNETPDNVVLLPITFTSKNLKSAKTYYNNIEQEVLGILHGSEN